MEVEIIISLNYLNVCFISISFLPLKFNLLNYKIFIRVPKTVMCFVDYVFAFCSHGQKAADLERRKEMGALFDVEMCRSLAW